MPSPFPGMDPYLEGDMWQEFHERLANQISVQLMQRLPSTYVALLAKRYVVERPTLAVLGEPTGRVVYPDVHVADHRPLRETAPGYPSVMAATAELLSPMSDAVPIVTVEVRDVANRRLVTAIEILSPVNKRGAGAGEYLERRTALLDTATHLLEIDLLAAGLRLPLFGKLPPATYYIYLSRAEHRPRTEVWAVNLADRLPVVPVPLVRPDVDVPLDLQAGVDACFAVVGYERLLDYTAPAPHGLSTEDAAWAEALLAGKGLRSAGRASL